MRLSNTMTFSLHQKLLSTLSNHTSDTIQKHINLRNSMDSLVNQYQSHQLPLRRLSTSSKALQNIDTEPHSITHFKANSYIQSLNNQYQLIKQRRREQIKRFGLILLVLFTVWAVISYIYNRQIKEFIARLIGNYITKNSRFTVVFEEASILPGWNQLYFKKCFISRRPKLQKQFVKGNQQDALDNAVKERDTSATTNTDDIIDDTETEEFDDGNYTQYDLTINEINLKISFFKWLNSKGILTDVEFKGVRGIIDRTHVYWDANDDARNYLNVPSPNDFNLESMKIEDFLVTLYQPGNFRPFNISIFNCNLPKLRQNWLLIDFLSANNINGSYDGSLFTINKIHDSNTNEFFTRCRIDGLNVDHLNAGVDGPFGWIVKGKVDMLGDLNIPNNSYSLEDFLKIVKNDVVEKLREKKKTDTKPTPESPAATKDIPPNIYKHDYDREYRSYYHDNDQFKLKLRIQLNNVKAKLPLFTNELSYLNYALMRPIIGYINSRQTYVAIDCDVVKDMKDFNGSWTVYDSLLMDDISNKVYEEFGNYVIDEEQKKQRVKKIGFWALHIMMQVLLLGLASIG